MIRPGTWIAALTLFLLSAGMLKAQDIEESTENQIRQVPIYEFWRDAFKQKNINQEQSDRVVTILIKGALQGLGYPVDFSRPDPPWRDSGFMASLKLFEKEAGLVADGSLTIEEFNVLQKAANVASNKESSIGSYAIIQDLGDSILATDTWIFDFDQQRIAFPKTVQIWCERHTWSCRSTAARVVMNDNPSPMLFLDEENFSVVSWQGDIVIAKSEKFPSSCRSVVLTINTRTKDIFTTSIARLVPGCMRLE